MLVSMNDKEANRNSILENKQILLKRKKTKVKVANS